MNKLPMNLNSFRPTSRRTNAYLNPCSGYPSFILCQPRSGKITPAVRKFFAATILSDSLSRVATREENPRRSAWDNGGQRRPSRQPPHRPKFSRHASALAKRQAPKRKRRAQPSRAPPAAHNSRSQPTQRRTSITVVNTNSRSTSARPMRKLISWVRSLNGSRRTASMA